MAKTILHSVSLIAFVLLYQTCSLVPAMSAGIPFVFKAPDGRDPSQISVQFASGSGYYKDTSGQQQNLETYRVYTLAELTSPVSVGGGAPANQPAVLINGMSGRIWITYSATGIPELQSSQPVASNRNDTRRWAYFEPTVDGSGVHVDISYIDCLAILFNLKAINAPNGKNTSLLTNATTTELVTSAAQSSVTPKSNVVPDASAMPPSASFARLLPPMADASLYHDWSYYLKTFLQGKSFVLEGCFPGTGALPVGASDMKRIGSQSYKFNGTFDANGDVTLISVPGESGIPKAVCGDYSNFGGIGDATITIPFTMLNSQNGIYGANAGYSATYNGSDSPASSGTITNDVFGEIVGDLLTGINFGYLGSTVMFTNTANPGGIAIGDLSSVNWWGGKDSNGNTIAQSQTPYGNRLKYGNVQSNPLNYNTYSNSVSPFTDAYTFAFEDRGGKVLLEFDTNTDPSAYLLVEMLPDGSSPGPGPTPGPTPGQTSVLPPYLLLEN